MIKTLVAFIGLALIEIGILRLAIPEVDPMLIFSFKNFDIWIMLLFGNGMVAGLFLD